MFKAETDDTDVNEFFIGRILKDHELSHKGSTIKQVEERGNGKSLITFYVRTKVSRETSTEEEPEIKTIAKYFVVPVAYDGQSYGCV